MISGIFLLLGSNLGDRKSHLTQAIAALLKEGITLTRCSALYRTAPWGMPDQPDYYNQVIEISTHMEPMVLLDHILSIEKVMGRTRNQQWEKRIIDIDLLYYHDQVINNKDLVVPHPRIQDRKFTLIPMCELAPDFIHPLLQKTQKKLLQECNDTLSVLPL